MAPEEFRAETPRPASTLRDLNPQAGRSFTRGDRRTTPLVAIVNEALVKRQWPRAADALGRRIRFWDKSYEIVGVIASIHEWVSKTVRRRPSTCRPIRSPCHGTSLELARSLTQGAQPAAKPAVGTEDPQVSALSVRDDNRSGVASAAWTGGPARIASKIPRGQDRNVAGNGDQVLVSSRLTLAAGPIRVTFEPR